MSAEDPRTVTRLLVELSEGRRTALDELLPLVYDELRRLARAQRRHWRGDETLGTTALVHEAYLKLVDQKRIDARTRSHFFAVTAKAMRHILCNYARDRRRIKRGGDAVRITLPDGDDGAPFVVAFPIEQAEELAALDEALRKLEAEDKRLGEVVECRFFGGMSIEETARALDISPATAKRAWNRARAWLYREMHRHRPDAGGDHGR